MWWNTYRPPTVLVVPPVGMLLTSLTSTMIILFGIDRRFGMAAFGYMVFYLLVMRGRVVRQFPYVIMYRLETTEIVVISIFHTSRDPSAVT